jgi:predicted GTPase
MTLVQNEVAVPPRIAVAGKAGVGKTTTVNVLFNASFATSHSVVGTLSPQEIEFSFESGARLIAIDMPGLGESIDADRDIELNYHQILPTVDVILYILQANERILAEDQRILRDVVIPSISNQLGKIVVGLNQVDKIGPGIWRKELNLPSDEQERSIERRCDDIAAKLSSVTTISSEQIVYYSAECRYRLYDVLAALVKAAGDCGWKVPLQPKDWVDIAAPEAQQYIRERRAQGGN